MEGEGNGGNTNNANAGRRSEEWSILGSAAATCQLVGDSIGSIERVHCYPFSLGQNKAYRIYA
jgi:hypothetical protein